MDEWHLTFPGPVHWAIRNTTNMLQMPFFSLEISPSSISPSSISSNSGYFLRSSCIKNNNNNNFEKAPISYAFCSTSHMLSIFPSFSYCFLHHGTTLPILSSYMSFSSGWNSFHFILIICAKLLILTTSIPFTNVICPL